MCKLVHGNQKGFSLGTPTLGLTLAEHYGCDVIRYSGGPKEAWPSQEILDLPKPRSPQSQSPAPAGAREQMGRYLNGQQAARAAFLGVVFVRLDCGEPALAGERW
jgi:hypothetical protein